MPLAGSNHPMPTAITLHGKSQNLQVSFSDGADFYLPFEFLRVHSPSAEVQGHGPGQQVLQTGKRGVTITVIEPVGNYGIQPRFSDGHDTGIFTWQYLHALGRDQDALWQAYLHALNDANESREPNGTGIQTSDIVRHQGGCA
jgi:DUF971 family protein